MLYVLILLSKSGFAYWVLTILEKVVGWHWFQFSLAGRDIRRKHNQKCNYGKILAGQVGALQSLMWQTQCTGHKDQPIPLLCKQQGLLWLWWLWGNHLLSNISYIKTAISESLLGRNQRLRYACVIVCSMGELLIYNNHETSQTIFITVKWFITIFITVIP